MTCVTAPLSVSPEPRREGHSLCVCVCARVRTACALCPQEAWLLSRERQLKEELRRGRDKEIELAIWTLEEETSKDKEACDRAADSRCVCVRLPGAHDSCVLS